MHGADENLDIGVERRKVFDEFQSPPPRHIQIGDNKIWLGALHGGQGLGFRRGGGADFVFGMRLQDEAVAGEDGRMIIDEEDPVWA